MVRAQVHSTKHYVQQSLATVTGGAQTNVLIAQGVSAPSANLGNEVREGATVKAVFIEMWVRSSSATPSTVLMTFLKTVDLQTPLFADMTGLFNYTNKKNVFYHTQGLVNDNDANAIAFVRQWFKVPKGKQRMGLGDSLFLSIAAQAPVDVQICGFATYKEYY